LIFSVNFNAPLTTYSNNAFTGNAFDVTPTRVNPSAAPAKDRGLYWDGTEEGYVEIPSLLLHNSFSIHSWVLIKDGTVTCTLFTASDQTT
jgi:hypothetical protein